MKLGLEPTVQAEIGTSRLGLGPLGWDWNLKAEIGALRLRYVL